MLACAGEGAPGVVSVATGLLATSATLSKADAVLSWVHARVMSPTSYQTAPPRD